jgi:hypothetical protein
MRKSHGFSYEVKYTEMSWNYSYLIWLKIHTYIIYGMFNTFGSGQLIVLIDKRESDVINGIMKYFTL